MIRARKQPLLFKLILVFLSLSPLSALSHGYSSDPLRKELLIQGKQVTILRANVNGVTRVSSIRIEHEGYTEIRVDSDFDGWVDIREFSDSTKRARYSMPRHGYFQHLELERREKKGVRYQEFFLSARTHRYVRVTNRFRKYGIQALDGRRTPATSGTTPEAPLQCRASEPQVLGAPTTSLRLALRLLDPNGPDDVVNSQMLDGSCGQPPFSTEQQELTHGIEEVLNSRKQDTPKFAGCLKTQGLGYYANRLDSAFSEMLAASEPTVFCRETSDRLLGSYFEGENAEHANIRQISFLKTSGSSGRSADHTRQFYSEVFFHESLHRAGMSDEDLVRSIVACCSQPPGAATQACNGMHEKVRKLNVRNSHLSAAVGNLEGFQEIWEKLEFDTTIYSHRLSLSPARAQLFFDEYLAQTAQTLEHLQNEYQQCVSSAPNRPEAQQRCRDQGVLKTVHANRRFFSTGCPAFFGNQESSRTACETISHRVETLIRTNANRSCRAGSSGETATLFEDSCLLTAAREATSLQAAAASGGPNGQVPSGVVVRSDQATRRSQLGAQDLQNTRAVQNMFLDSYYTAFLNHLGSRFDDFFHQIGSVTEREQGLELAKNLFIGFGDWASEIDEQQSLCVNHQTPTAPCAQRTADILHGRIAVFFRETCPSYIRVNNARGESAQNTCRALQSQLWRTFESNMNGGCTRGRLPNSTGPNLTCIDEALDEAEKNRQAYYQPPNQRPRPLIQVSELEFWYRTSETELAQAAAAPSGTPLALNSRTPQNQIAPSAPPQSRAPSSVGIEQSVAAPPQRPTTQGEIARLTASRAETHSQDSGTPRSTDPVRNSTAPQQTAPAYPTDTRTALRDLERRVNEEDPKALAPQVLASAFEAAILQQEASASQAADASESPSTSPLAPPSLRQDQSILRDSTPSSPAQAVAASEPARQETGTTEESRSHSNAPALSDTAQGLGDSFGFGGSGGSGGLGGSSTPLGAHEPATPQPASMDPTNPNANSLTTPMDSRQRFEPSNPAAQTAQYGPDNLGAQFRSTNPARFSSSPIQQPNRSVPGANNSPPQQSRPADPNTLAQDPTIAQALPIAPFTPDGSGSLSKGAHSNSILGRTTSTRLPTHPLSPAERNEQNIKNERSYWLQFIRQDPLGSLEAIKNGMIPNAVLMRVGIKIIHGSFSSGCLISPEVVLRFRPDGRGFE